MLPDIFYLDVTIAKPSLVFQKGSATITQSSQVSIMSIRLIILSTISVMGFGLPSWSQFRYSQPGLPGYVQRNQPGLPGYVQNNQPGLPGYVQKTQPGLHGYVQTNQPGLPGYVQDTQPGLPGYVQDKSILGL